MRSLLTALIFTVMFSSTSFAGWKEVTESVDDETFYVDIERVRKVDGYIYYWMLMDLSTPLADGNVFSAVLRNKIDCPSEGMKSNPIHYYTQEMGKGDRYMSSEIEPSSWTYPPPGSAYYALLGVACDYDF